MQCILHVWCYHADKFTACMIGLKVLRCCGCGQVKALMQVRLQP